MWLLLRSCSQSRIEYLVFLAVMEIIKETLVCMQIFSLLFHITVFPLCFTERKTGRHIMQVGTLCFVVWSGNKHRCFELVKHMEKVPPQEFITPKKSTLPNTFLCPCIEYLCRKASWLVSSLLFSTVQGYSSMPKYQSRTMPLAFQC